MSGSKIVVKKPLRRYERAFDEEKAGSEETESAEGTQPPVNPDITLSKAVKGTVMSSKRIPFRYRVKTVPAKDKEEERSRGEDPGAKSGQA